MKHQSPLNDNGDNEVVSSSGGLTEDQKAIISDYHSTFSDPTLPNWEKEISDDQILAIDSLKTGKGKYKDMTFHDKLPMQRDIMRDVWYKSTDQDKKENVPSWIQSWQGYYDDPEKVAEVKNN